MRRKKMRRGILKVSLATQEPQSDLLRKVPDERCLPVKYFLSQYLGMHNWVEQWIQYLVEMFQFYLIHGVHMPHSLTQNGELPQIHGHLYMIVQRIKEYTIN